MTKSQDDQLIKLLLIEHCTGVENSKPAKDRIFFSFSLRYCQGSVNNCDILKNSQHISTSTKMAGDLENKIGKQLLIKYHGHVAVKGYVLAQFIKNKILICSRYRILTV